MRSVFAVLPPPYPREGISDVLARGSIIQVLMVLVSLYEGRKDPRFLFGALTEWLVGFLESYGTLNTFKFLDCYLVFRNFWKHIF